MFLFFFCLGLGLGVGLASLVLAGRNHQLRQELRAAQHALGLYRSDAVLANLRREVQALAQALDSLRGRFEGACRTLKAGPGGPADPFSGGGGEK